jgi:hypothetical protein
MEPQKDIQEETLELYSIPALSDMVTAAQVQQMIGSQLRNLSEPTVLQKNFLKSANFVSGSSGWYIDAQGNAEFNDGTFRGVFNVGNNVITVSTLAGIQTAINTVSADGGGTVYVTAGTYIPTSNITLYSNVNLIGTGATIIDFNGGSYSILAEGTNQYTTGTIAVTNGNNTITGTGTTFTAGMVGRYILIGDFWYKITTFTSTTSIAVGGTTAYSGPTASGIGYIIADRIYNASIQNIYVKNSATTGIKITAADKFLLSEVTYGCFGLTSDKGVNVTSSAGLILRDSSVLNGDYGFYFYKVKYSEANNLNVSFTNVTGITFSGCSNFQTKHLNVNSTVAGYGLELSGIDNMLFDSFNLTNIRSNCIRIQTTACTNTRFIGGSINTNTFSNNSGIYIAANADNLQFIGNNIVNCVGYGINNVASSNTDIILVGNYFSNNALGSYSNSGTRSICVGNTDVIDTNPQWSRVTSQFDKTNATAAAITGLSANLLAGKIYAFEAILFVDADVTGGMQFDMGGTATATSFIMDIVCVDDAANNMSIVIRRTALASGVTQAGNVAGMCRMTGTIVVNAAGTLTPRFAQSTASGTSSILVNSTFMVRQII